MVTAPLQIKPINESAVDVLIVRLKGGAGGVLAICRVGRTYGDLLGGAIGLAIMIHAVLYVAANTLDMVAAATVSLFGHDDFFLFSFLRGFDPLGITP